MFVYTFRNVTPITIRYSKFKISRMAGKSYLMTRYRAAKGAIQIQSRSSKQFVTNVKIIKDPTLVRANVWLKGESWLDDRFKIQQFSKYT